MENMLTKMLPMDFQVTKEAAEFATEAHIRHMCTVANLIKTCCFEALAYDLVTSLGPERFAEWKAALINEAAGKVPHLFRMLEEDVRKEKFQPLSEEGALKYGHVTPGHLALLVICAIIDTEPERELHMQNQSGSWHHEAGIVSTCGLGASSCLHGPVQ
jgi:hypothetical protein